MWFTNEQGRSIGRITPQGDLTEYTDPRIATPTAITAGPDGAMWFANGAGSMGRITMAGVVTTFSANIASPVAIASGPDGAIWFTTGGKAIGRMAPDGSVTTFADPAQMRGTYGITAGPDGAVWFTNYLGSSIGRIAADGTVSTFTDPRIRYPTRITAGPDGALWFTDDSGSIGRITVDGVVSSYGNSSTVGHPLAITVGPDRALWAADRGGSIVRITVGGVISRYTAPTIDFPDAIAAGQDGALWFTNYTGNSIGRVSIIPATPLVTFSRPGTVKASVVRSVAGSVVRIPIRVTRPSSLTLTVRNPRTGLKLRLQPGSRVATTILKRPAASVSASISGARAWSWSRPRSHHENWFEVATTNCCSTPWQKTERAARRRSAFALELDQGTSVQNEDHMDVVAFRRRPQRPRRTRSLPAPGF